MFWNASLLPRLVHQMEAKVGQLKNIIEFNETDLKEVLQARNEAIGE